MSTRPTVFVGGPFSTALREERGTLVFDPPLREKFDLVHRTLQRLDVRLRSSHLAEHFGQDIQEDSLVQRDNSWLRTSDAYLALLPVDAGGRPWRSDGTFVEIGQALGLGKLVVMLIEDRANPAWSYYVRNLDLAPGVIVLDYAAFQADPMRVLREGVVVPLLERAGGTREGEISDVSAFLACCRHQQEPDLVTVRGVEFHVSPGVFSPRYSRSSEFLVDCWRIPRGTRVLDMGCGCGVLGITALLDGAASLTAVDINPRAVADTLTNLERLHLARRADVLLSDAYEKVTGRYDVIVANPPYWNRPAADDLERACFDEDYCFLRALFEQAADHARPGCLFFVVFSDQGDYHLVQHLLKENGWEVLNFHLLRPAAPGGHIRIAWEAKLR